MVRCPLRGRRVLGSKPDSTKNSALYIGLLRIKLYVEDQTSSLWCGCWSGGWRARFETRFQRRTRCKRVWCTANPSRLNVHPLVWCGSLEGGDSSGAVLVIKPEIALSLF
ncbi:hypothetical protein AVEN_267302-1 [Araneus ventricosus]|uniref:Uncharacterized protein n=1 Tax=Araneus ventricosus TaxID=182803 RepID=A0A4Y2DMM6_ARAVE|nr:hypothetical protein AVEN_267302-1 [Araneus ventricosus]